MAVVNFSVTFTGSQDTVAAVWAARPGNYAVLLSAPWITDLGGAVSLWLTGVTSSGATVNTSERFSGIVSGVVVDTP